MERNNDTHMIANNTFLGFVPANAKIYDDNILARLYFDNAAANVNPPINIIIVEFHIVLKYIVMPWWHPLDHRFPEFYKLYK